jgi:hypothetical protein
MQVAIDFIAIAIMLSFAGAVGRRAFMQPKADDHTWQIVPNLDPGEIA